MRISFSLMIGAGAVLIHLYLYRRVLRHVAPTAGWRRTIAGVLAAFTLLLLLRGPFRDLGPDVARVYAIVAYSWMAVALCLLLAVMLGDVVRGVLAVWSWVAAIRARRAEQGTVAAASPRAARAEDVDEDRRAFVTRTLPWSIVAGGSVVAGYGVFRAVTAPEVTEHAIRIAKLPRNLDGLSIVQLTDIHVGPFVRRRWIDALVEQTNGLRPDLVVVTGDLVDGDVPTLGHAVAGLANLRSRFGTFFVTGNHDYYSGDEAWTKFLEGLGIQVLRNRRASIGDAGGSIDLIGVDDWSGGRRSGKKGYDLDAALAGRDVDRASVLLAHQPANFEVAAARGMDLQISGHTHGGQLFPMTMLIGLHWQYSRGLYPLGDSHIYVSRGCGFWGPPARVGSPPEIAKLVLTT